MKSFRNVALMTIFLLVLAAFSGCAQPGSEQGTSTTIQGTPTSEGGATGTAQPKIKIVSPEDGSTVSGNKIKVEIEVENFSLVEKLGQPKSPGEGHVHYILDNGPPTRWGQNTVTLEVKPGKHTLTVELHNNDHSALDPPVSATSEFTVE